MSAIGLDVGGSKTVGVLVDAAGCVLRHAKAGGANVRSVGEEIARTNLSAVLRDLSRGVDVQAVCIGTAGIDRRGDRERFESLVRGLLPAGAELGICHDGQIALRAGTEQRPAIVVIAGTGSLVYGERSDGSGVRSGGYGAVIGDDGSGYAAGLAAVKHAACALDGVEESGPLARAVLDALGASTVAELIEKIHVWPPDVGAIAALAPLVGDAAEAGDPAAGAIVENQAALLGRHVERVARSVRSANELPVVLAGGAFDAVAALVPVVESAARKTGPARIERLTAEPALGAARLALQLVHG